MSIDTRRGFDVEIDYAMLQKLTDPEALAGWESACNDPLSREEYRKVHAFAFGAGAGIIAGLQVGAEMEELALPFVNMAKDTLSEEHYHEGLGAMVELWNFGGKFFEVCQKLGFEWCDNVQLSSERMGKYQELPSAKTSPLLQLIEKRRSSINVA